MYYHSSHNAYVKKSNPYMTLRWMSNLFLPGVIPEENLFFNNIPTPLQVTGYYKDSFILALMQDQAQAFFDSKNFILNDIPKNY